MVSLQAVSDAQWNLIYTQNIKDLRKPIQPKEPKACPGNLMSLIQDNPDFSIFNYMIGVGQLYNKFNSPQANFTIFVPTDSFLRAKYSENMFKNMDLYTARETVLYHTLRGKVTFDMLRSSKCMYLDTMIDKSVYSKILVESRDNTVVLNNTARMKAKDIQLTNGMIHIITDLLIPPVFVDNLRPYFVCG